MTATLEAATPAAVPPSTATRAITVTEPSVLCPLVVIVEFAQRSVAWLVLGDDHHAAGQAGGRGQRALHHLLGRQPRGHRPSSAVFSTLTPRNRADGQPWLTAATCPGWALPQFIAPCRRQVDGPPTASSEPQKSVVVAW